MKKLLFLLLPLFLFSGPINTETLQNEVIKDIVKEAAKNDITPSPTAITAESGGILPNFTGSGTCNTYEDLKCPTAAEGFFVRKQSSDLKTGKVECLVYSPQNLDRAMYNYTYTNPTCAQKWAIDNSLKVSPALEAITAQSDKENEMLKIIQSQAKSRVSALTDTQLNLSDLLVAVFTQDGKKIDLALSISQGRVKVADGYTAIVDSNAKGGLSDLSVEALNGKVVAIFEFMSSANDPINLAIFILCILFLGGYFIKSGLLLRLLDSKERENKTPALLWVAGVFGATLFFLIPNVNLNINANQRFEQSNFHGVLQEVFSQASKLSNKINLAAHNATFKAILKERGYKSKEGIYHAAAENVLLEKLVVENRTGLERCNQLFDKEQLKKYINGGSFVYPLSEEELYRKWIINNPNVATSPYYDLLQPIYKNGDNAKKLGLTLSQCGQYERSYNVSKLKLAQNLKYLAPTGIQVDQERNAYIQKIIERQYKAISDWGFISAAFLPSTIAELELDDYYATSKQQSSQFVEGAYDKLKSGEIFALTPDMQIREMSEKIMYQLPYLLVPGATSVKDTIHGMGQGVASSMPFIGGLIAVASYSAGVVVGIEYAKIVLLIAPLLIMTIVGLIMGIILFFQIIAYFISGFFAIILAFWSNSGENIFKFLGKGLKLFAKIVGFPATMFFALFSHWITMSIGSYLSSAFANSNNGQGLGLGFQLFGGFLNIVIVIVSIFLTFKIITSLTDFILENLSLSSKDLLDQSAEQIQNQTARLAIKKV